MKVNWKVRFKNSIWLGSFISAVLVILYTILDLFGIIPSISEYSMVRIVEAILMILSLTGVIVDPTTQGFGDSARAQGYLEPWSDDPEGGNG